MGRLRQAAIKGVLPTDVQDENDTHTQTTAARSKPTQPATTCVVDSKVGRS